MRAAVFIEQTKKLLEGMGATEIDVTIDASANEETVAVCCKHKGERYEMTRKTESENEKLRERVRDLVLDAVRRFANGE